MAVAMTESNTDEYMTATEARLALGITKNLMTRWIKDGILKVEKNPFDARLKLVRRADVAALAKQRLPKPTKARKRS